MSSTPVAFGFMVNDDLKVFVDRDVMPIGVNIPKFEIVESLIEFLTEIDTFGSDDLDELAEILINIFDHTVALERKHLQDRIDKNFDNLPYSEKNLNKDNCHEFGVPVKEVKDFHELEEAIAKIVDKYGDEK